MNTQDQELIVRVDSLDDFVALGVQRVRAQLEAERERAVKAAEERMRKVERMLEEVKENLPLVLRPYASFSRYEVGDAVMSPSATVLIELQNGGRVRFNVRWSKGYEIVPAYFGHLYQAADVSNKLYHTDDLAIAVAGAMGALEEVL